MSAHHIRLKRFEGVAIAWRLTECRHCFITNALCGLKWKSISSKRLVAVADDSVGAMGCGTIDAVTAIGPFVIPLFRFTAWQHPHPLSSQSSSSFDPHTCCGVRSIIYLLDCLTFNLIVFIKHIHPIISRSRQYSKRFEFACAPPLIETDTKVTESIRRICIKVLLGFHMNICIVYRRTYFMNDWFFH